MPNMKLIKTLLATTLTLTAAATFAAKQTITLMLKRLKKLWYLPKNNLRLKSNQLHSHLKVQM